MESVHSRLTPEKREQTDLSVWVDDLEAERERVAAVIAERAGRRGYPVVATDPEVAPGALGYREVYATEAGTPNQALAKVRPITEGRRLRAYLATGRYPDELSSRALVA